MSKGFDYSKWDNIELSDDEDDVHPNIEKESWFRMKHRSRVEREEREEKEKKEILAEMKTDEFRIKEISKIISKLDEKGDGDEEEDDDDEDDLEDKDGLLVELEELNNAQKARQDKLDAFERNKIWNVDNICQVKEEKTIITKSAAEDQFSETGYALPPKEGEGSVPAPKEEDEVRWKKPEDSAIKKEDQPKEASTASKAVTADVTKGEEKIVKSEKAKQFSDTSDSGPRMEKESASVAMLGYPEFTEKYEDVLEKFMAIRDFEKSKQFLLLHGKVLLQENASSYLLLACLEDEMNGYREKMRLTARQSQMLTNIVELSKTVKKHPGNVIIPFFKRIEEPEFLKGFMEGVEVFINRVIQRAITKKKEIDAEREAERESATKDGTDLASIPREERLGPGGLDPMEVFESLPIAMQEAFESREIDKLKEALMKMDPKDAEYHMKRCVDCGLWNESS
mmetsp:Transcript_33195/g.48711  ORF Transcript_33195/g.48711 Transcript_33195/m.48711 type:complete len:454 (-) Transcript_33195:324-1685(-)|eukprot:CAMPEP_0195517040 /NCGR_PEP_ID=MMETSP0794_2-20130614/9526_1 /TAXON_ID=515487 /ORGANISM="Stephanopyxis turris, Strain CCMP 815" /LENGTH=453 /DNA_ID=CAMNT_0040645777 /DNA_START=59 /DNA_END=1420 /DNA_ORIENTATION=-